MNNTDFLDFKIKEVRDEVLKVIESNDLELLDNLLNEELKLPHTLQFYLLLTIIQNCCNEGLMKYVIWSFIKMSINEVAMSSTNTGKNILQVINKINCFANDLDTFSNDYYKFNKESIWDKDLFDESMTEYIIHKTGVSYMTHDDVINMGKEDMKGLFNNFKHSFLVK